MRKSVLVVILAAACGGSQNPEPTPAPPPAAEPKAAEPAAQGPPSWTLAGLAKGAAALDDLGSHHREVTTKVPEAQAFFDQGLRLTYGFNHDEAARSFARAAELDPSCALCFWGAAYTLGPNYNVPMLPERAIAAWDALEGARAAAKSATPAEQGLIEALGKRYTGPEWVDPVAMATRNEAFAAAMREVAGRFPDDKDVQVLFAEALMNVRPWKLWTPDGKPEPGTEEVVATLEKVLAAAPEHPGANHYYIHAIEASTNPGKATPSADRLPGLMPAAGHTVHMPAHIYQRVGRYADASEANRRAIVVDEKYIAKLPPPGYYPFYLGHNYGFLAYSSSMEGRGAESLAAARKAAQTIPHDIVCGMPGMDFFLSEPLLVMVRFGRWDELLAESEPEAKYQALDALWHHARGMALAAKGETAEARKALDTILAIAKDLPPELLTGLNPGKSVLALAAKVLEARIAESEKAPEAIARWEEAVAMEDALAYSEPSDWFYPTRHFLGAALLDAGRAKDAEAVYRADLLHNPGNGWALFGVWKSVAGQKGKSKKDADAAEKDFKKAWERADIQLTRTAF